MNRSCMKNLTFILFALLLASCCKQDLIDTIRFSESDLLVNPYTGNETLKFVDDSSNIVTYDNGSRSIFMEEFPECDGGCCDYYLVESSDNTYFESAYLLSNLQITITNQFDRFNGIQNPPIISFAWVYYENHPNPTYTNYASLPVDRMEEVAISQQIFKDSLMLHDITYYQVFTLPGICSSPERLYADTLFYTKTDGVIGLKFTDGNLWSLDN